MNNPEHKTNIIYIIKKKRSVVVNDKEVFYDETVAECTEQGSADKMLEHDPDTFIEIRTIKS